MSDTKDDAMLGEEIAAAGEAPVPEPPSPSRNALTELMAPKPKPVAAAVPQSEPRRAAVPRSHLPPSFPGRDALGALIASPASLPGSVIIYFNDAFVAVRDKFPKASVHALLLPRDPARSRMHPFDAFGRDDDFLTATRRESARLRAMAAAELRRRFGGESQRDAARRAALLLAAEAEGGGWKDRDRDRDSDGNRDRGSELPRGRDWEAEIRIGVHAHPSMNHLHIHIISPDMFSTTMKHRKHYNSFHTPFFVELDQLPLAPDDPRRSASYLRTDLRCWRCGAVFGNKFKALKEHLAEEFEAWRRE